MEEWRDSDVNLSVNILLVIPRIHDRKYENQCNFANVGEKDSITINKVEFCLKCIFVLTGFTIGTNNDVKLEYKRSPLKEHILSNCEVQLNFFPATILLYKMWNSCLNLKVFWLKLFFVFFWFPLRVLKYLQWSVKICAEISCLSKHKFNWTV